MTLLNTQKQKILKYLKKREWLYTYLNPGMWPGHNVFPKCRGFCDLSKRHNWMQHSVLLLLEHSYFRTLGHFHLFHKYILEKFVICYIIHKKDQIHFCITVLLPIKCTALFLESLLRSINWGNFVLWLIGTSIFLEIKFWGHQSWNLFLAGYEKRERN